MNRYAMTRCFCAMVVALAALAASATEMYYKGDLPGGITNAQNYCRTTRLSPDERYDRLPGSSDEIVIVGSNVTIDLDDGHFDFLKTIRGINLKQSSNFRCNLHIEQDQTLPCWIADYSGYGSWKTGFLVKTGSGDLHTPTNLTSATSGGTRMSYDVQEGDLYLNAVIGGSAIASHLRIAENCTVHAPSNTRVVVSSLSGAGTFTNDATESPQKDKDFYLGGDASETEPTVFSGRLRGKWYVVNLNGYTYFTGTENDFSCALRGRSATAGDPNRTRAVGFMTYPESGASSLGTSSTIDNREGPLRLRYLGTAPITAGRKITVNDTTVGPTTIDGGMWGGLTWTAYFELVNQGGAIGKQQRVAFTGTNAGERCEFSGYMNRRASNGTNYSFHVTKDGPGTWRFIHNGSSPWRGALTVRDGTLEFDTIAETNKLCALGKATECYPDECDYTPNLTPVDWAWRLGDASDSSVTGSLKYVGTKDMHLTSRKTALAGAGRFRFGEGSLFKYSAGISGLDAGEKAMCFEGAAGATNVIADISDGDGTVSVVKEGAGKTVLTGNLGFSGDLRVEGGELVLQDINNADYRYYRINFKENVSTSTHPGLEEYKARYSTQKDAFRVTAFGFYNAGGTSVFTDPGETNISYLALEPGHGQLQDFEDIKLYYNPNYGGILGGVRRLFGNNCAAGTVFSPQWRDGRKPVPGNPDTWIRVHIHLAENVAPPVLWDMCYDSSTNSSYYAMNATAFSIDASADGVSWQEVAATNNIVHLYATSHAWLSNTDPPEWDSSKAKNNGNSPELQSHPNKFPLAATKQQGTYARPAPRSVFVRSGATLRNESSTSISVSGLTLDVAGMGALEGFTFAPDGTLTVEGMAGVSSVTIPTDFSGASGYANLSRWQLVVAGESTHRYVIGRVSETGITIAKRGLVMSIR